MTVTPTDGPLEGGCTCRLVRYRLASAPMFVHCCHCRWCQRETGSAFAINALIESDRVERLGAEPELVDTPSQSGAGQLVARCPRCRVAVWSHYAGAGKLVSFIRAGTLDEPDRVVPDIHIYTESKQPWVQLPPDAKVMPQFYRLQDHWPADSLARKDALVARAKSAAREQEGPGSPRARG